MNFTELRRPLILMNRSILWPVGILALLGSLWREPATPTWTTIILLAVWGELMIFLCRVPPIFERETIRDVRRSVFWLPVIFMGAFFPVRDWFVYLVVLGVFEATRQLPLKRGTAVLPIPDSPSENRRDSWMGLPAARSRRTLPTTTVQQLARKKDELGRERLECQYLVEFVNDQELAWVHIPFCPIFESSPRVSALLEEGVPARLTIHPPYVFGVRIDVRRTGSQSRFLLFVDIEGPMPGDPDTPSKTGPVETAES